MAKNDAGIRQEGNVLRVERHFEFSKCQGVGPVYTEYTVGHYARGQRATASVRALSVATRP
jgi:HSP20 family protein